MPLQVDFYGGKEDKSSLENFSCIIINQTTIFHVSNPVFIAVAKQVPAGILFSRESLSGVVTPVPPQEYLLMNHSRHRDHRGGDRRR